MNSVLSSVESDLDLLVSRVFPVLVQPLEGREDLRNRPQLQALWVVLRSCGQALFGMKKVAVRRW